MNALDTCEESWAGELRRSLQQKPMPAEGLLPGYPVHYFRVQKESVHILPLTLDPVDTLFTAWRSGYYLALKRQLHHLYGLTHNLRSPITGIRSRAELLEQKLAGNMQSPSNDPIRQGLAKIQVSADDIQSQLKTQERLFSWILDPTESGPFLLHDVIEVLLAYMQTDLFFKKDVAMTVELGDRSPVLRFPPGRLAESLLFMIQDFTDTLRDTPNPRITLRTGMLDNNECMIELSRSGPMMAFMQSDETIHGPLPIFLSAGLWLAHHFHASVVVVNDTTNHVCLQLRIPLHP